MHPIIKKILVASFILLIAIEVSLRYFWGFCNAPLYIADPDYEYIYAPHQNVTRYGNRIITNSMSLRNEEVSPADSIRILLIGDSVVNGGSMTDQDSIASAILEKRLTREFGKTVRILNISAGSWGPDNGAAYLKKHGLFDAQLMCLVTSSHDAYDTMTHHDQVGVDPNLPDKQYPWALVEMWDRYLYPLFIKDLLPSSMTKAPKMPAGFGAAIRKDGVEFNPGYGQLNAMAKEHGIPFFILLHPEISEVKQNAYDDQGLEIIAFAKQDSIRLIQELDYQPTLDLYRLNDVIHYNNKGQVFLANHLHQLFMEYLNPKE